MKERETRRKEKYFNLLKEKWPALTFAASTLTGAGILFLYLRRRTKEKSLQTEIDKIVEGTLLPGSQEASKKLGNAAILTKVADLAQALKELGETPEGRKTLTHLEEAWSKVSPGEGNLEQKITTLAAFVAEEIEEAVPKK